MRSVLSPLTTQFLKEVPKRPFAANLSEDLLLTQSNFLPQEAHQDPGQLIPFSSKPAYLLVEAFPFALHFTQHGSPAIGKVSWRGFVVHGLPSFTG
jgi:hypothetical protein